MNIELNAAGAYIPRDRLDLRGSADQQRLGRDHACAGQLVTEARLALGELALQRAAILARSRATRMLRLGFDELTEDSKLFKAMAAKYGDPSYKNPPGEMRWKGEDTQLEARRDTASAPVL